jgi:ferritin-like metal-binding protein YciE
MSSVPGKLPALKMPPQLETPLDLLLEQLGQLLTVEETLARLVLPKLAREVSDDELKQAVQEHLEETRVHVGNVKQAFLALGFPPAGRPALGLDGLRSEHESKVPKVSTALRPGVHCSAAMGTEHYEINAYEAAIRVADAIGAGEVSSLLRANLEEEVAALATLGEQADRLARLAVEEPTI